ncbi:MAG: hypothetical protein ACT4OY_06905 [Alphaproteobacteria bacterium]
MSGVRLFMFILAIPALTVIAHDAYLFYLNPPQDFMLSATGFLWTKYSPDSFLWVKNAVDEDTWGEINFVLQQKALFVAVAFAFFFYFILALLQLFRIWPFRRNEKSQNFSRRRA